MTDRFDLQAHLRNVYAKYPAAQSQPIIGITGNYEDLTCKLGQGYYKSVVAAGGVPIVIPPVADTNTLFNTLDHIDALILSGGGDFNPLYGGEEPSNRLHDINSERDLPELILTQMAYNRQMPILGICRGIQTLAMALGGRVWQDINEKTVTKHSQQAARSEVTHSVNIEEDSLLYQMYQEGFRYYLTKLEEKQLNEANQPFRLVSPEEEFIMCRLRKPKRNETPKRMSSTMICQLLVGGPGRGLSIQKISQAMRKCGFNSIQRSGYELFLVVEIPYDQQQNYLSLEKDESQNLEEETPQTLDNQQLDLPF